MGSYLTVTCRLAADSEERLSELLGAWPVLGCEVEPSGSEIAITIYLAESNAAVLPELCADLTLMSASELAAGRLGERDWLAEYRRHARPLAIGRRLWIDQNPASPTPPPAGRVSLLIEPRQAFGTGSHESTRLILELLEELPLAGRSVVDVGCGSGILALASRAFGARQVVAFDIDTTAVIVARQTVAMQCPALPVDLFAGTIDALREETRFDIVLANMIPAEFLPFLEKLRAVTGEHGTLVLSGVMADQRAAVEAELETCGLVPTHGRTMNEWVALVCRVA